MNILKLSENISSLRKSKKITQDDLAAFIGVTKASVSKWETGQSMPDILLLPQLATFFNVSVDFLLGYEPQLSKEQIQQIYLDYTKAFSKEPFENVLSKVQTTTHQYYSCFPLLLQIAVLYLNHFPMAPTPEASQKLLLEASNLCTHIIDDCTIVTICNDAISVKAFFDLVLGNGDCVIDALEGIADPARISTQNEGLLLQAYQLSEKKEQAEDYVQIILYQHLLSLISTSIQSLIINEKDIKGCKETIARVDAVAKAYKLLELHPNLMAQFSYQSALFFLHHKEEKAAIERLKDYEKAVNNLMHGDCLLHGDEYFTRLNHWIDHLPLGANPPRNKTVVAQSIISILQTPDFASLQNSAEFNAMIKRLKGEL